MPVNNRLSKTLQRTLAIAALLVLAGCAAVPDEERLLVLQADGQVGVRNQPCGKPRPAVAGPAAAGRGALDPQKLRILNWNLHKGEDKGWQADLGRFAAEHDVLLIQEAVLNDPERQVLEAAGHAWQMVGAFAFRGTERGVLTAARAAVLDSCTTRTFEPVTYLPKTALVVRYALSGQDKTVAIANLHGINFSLGLGSFREQLEGVAAELARHDGPVVLGGDFNTWSNDRHAALGQIAGRLGLVAVQVTPDGRRRTFGLHLDHLWVRGFKVLSAQAPEVKSSDHNPILVTLSLN